ncbi:MAG TPA: serine/threonine-protein kinase, partial [Jatrophihabitans sp.]|nr:serine/threonine-protein kinase [Jatrophihabitans sp.]
DEHVLIASELVDGGSVGTLIGDYGALAEPTVAVLLDQLLDALEHVHAAGIVHRDVKPANLLLRATGTGQPHLMLSDFGIAMGAEDAHLTQVGTVVGTPAYLAPELLAGGRGPDPRQDLYAAGRVAVALLSGQQPIDFAPVPVTAAPGPLRDLVTALAAPLPTHRPPSAAVARGMLRPALGGGGALRTAGGEPVDVLHQLPPLPGEALAEAAATASGGDQIGAAGVETAPLVEQPPSTVLLPAPRPARRGRRRWLVGVAAGSAAAAIGVPVALAMTGTSAGGGNPPSSPQSGQSSVSAGRSATGPPTPSPAAAVHVGSRCTWQQEGDRVTTTTGTVVVCTNRNGGYVWARS